jgi:hypothetical protein
MWSNEAALVARRYPHHLTHSRNYLKWYFCLATCDLMYAARSLAVACARSTRLAAGPRRRRRNGRAAWHERQITP